ncbi:PH domain-containing protein [Streptomyces sp. N50]|uniref:PH domain-containing protein n=1 Tax=Streptomyces sp. N50 TaxID=3081765 RepID=UPI0029622F80|nr:PH domain-containing protein [Streptomyces sp. N50]WOX12088.1 PH domain-containing protein [Streptomyces sp. N50]
MTTPHPEPKDRIYRSPAGLIGGVLLLAIACWLGIDALVSGHGRTPWLALAGLILVVPAVAAFTLRPAVYANQDRLRVRNPFRVVVLPWGEIASLRSGFSNEVVTKAGAKFQLWSVPVSLRGRKKAARREAKAAAEAAGARRGGRSGALGFGGGLGGFGGGMGAGSAMRGGATPSGPARAESDQIMADLRELLETREQAESAQGEVTVRWAYEVIGPVVAGAVLLAILLATG